MMITDLVATVTLVASRTLLRLAKTNSETDTSS